MQTTTSRLTSGTETDEEFATWRTADVEHYLACQRALLARKRPNRIPTRRGRMEVIALRDRLQAELDRRATEQIPASQLRDGDVIVNPSQGGEEIPVLLATRYGDLVMIWTNPDKGFVLSPSLTVQIKRRETDWVQAWTDISEELLLATETQGREAADAILLALDAASAEASRLAEDADHQDDSFDPTWCKDAVKAYRRIRPAEQIAVREPSTYEDPAVVAAILGFGETRKAGA